MTEENYEDVLANKGMPVPNVWIELEGEFVEFDKENESLKCKFPVRERYFNPLPTTLGGIIDSWIDITMGPLTVLLGQKAVNKNFSIKYLKPVLLNKYSGSLYTSSNYVKMYGTFCLK